MVAYIYNPSICEEEAGRLGDPSQAFCYSLRKPTGGKSQDQNLCGRTANCFLKSTAKPRASFYRPGFPMSGTLYTKTDKSW